MLFTTLLENSKKYGSYFALNNWTWTELIKIIANRPYVEFTAALSGIDILLDILKAASIDKPIVVPPLSGEFLPAESDSGFSLTLYSSGSTKGIKRPIKLSESFIMANAVNSITAHDFTFQDKVLTVSSMSHTGGINAQTIPALIAGAHVFVQQFNPYRFWTDIVNNSITVTHLVPRMMDVLSKLDKPTTTNLRLVTCGSDCVRREHVELMQNLGIAFMINYGMTEAGPIIINHYFDPQQTDLSIFDQGVPLGTQKWCDIKLINGQLYLRGANVIGNDWLATDDCVINYNNWLIYRGRYSAGCKIIPKSY